VLASLPSLRECLDALSGLHALEAELGDAAPEDVNDGETSATLDTGLATLRQRCPRFDEWVRCLEMLGA
jgi:hypothetical protein